MTYLFKHLPVHFGRIFFLINTANHYNLAIALKLDLEYQKHIYITGSLRKLKEKKTLWICLVPAPKCIEHEFAAWFIPRPGHEIRRGKALQNLLLPLISSRHPSNYKHSRPILQSWKEEHLENPLCSSRRRRPEIVRYDRRPVN